MKNLDQIYKLTEPNVIKENERIKNGGQEDSLQVSKLLKIYDNGFTAVKNVNFGV